MLAGAERIFVSYRRSDSGVIAGRIFDRLATAFGAKRVYMDIYTNDPGDVFHTRIDATLRRSTACIPLIGPAWETVTGLDAARPRLWTENDLVRRELEVSIEIGLELFPVLIDRQSPPTPTDLPSSLQGLLGRHMLFLSTNEKFHAQLDEFLPLVGRAVFRQRADISCVVVCLSTDIGSALMIESLVLAPTLEAAGIGTGVRIVQEAIGRHTQEIREADLLLLIGSYIPNELAYLLGERSAMARTRTLLLHHADVQADRLHSIQTVPCRIATNAMVEAARAQIGKAFMHFFER
jgi:hypothetical protein